MKIAAKFSGDIGQWAKEKESVAAKAVTGAIKAATDGLKLEFRQQIERVMGGRAANMVGSAVFPKGRASIGAAGTVFARGERADLILTAHTVGATIQSGSGFFLAIPTDAVPAGRKGKRLTPGEVEQRFGKRLRFVQRRNHGLLILEDVTAARNGKGFRNATAKRVAAGRDVASVVMFILVKQARLKRKLTPELLALKWAARVPEFIERALPPDR